jgi:segregation and condensation protein B
VSQDEHTDEGSAGAARATDATHGPQEAAGGLSEPDGPVDAESVFGQPYEGSEALVAAAGVEPEHSDALSRGSVEDGTSEDDVLEATLGAPTLEAALEAVLLVTDQPIDAASLAALVRRPAAEVVERLEALAEGYTADGRGFDLREVAGGWRFYTRTDCAEIVERYVRDGQQARLTQAALETLAVVAYRQPVSRARISAVRGVNVDGVIRTLTSRGLVAEAGHDETSGAILYRTTELFLERLGLTSLEELPPVADYLPDIELLDDFIEQTSS